MTTDLNNYNLNFITDNIQITVHNFMVDAFENICGYDTHRHSSYELHYVREGYGVVVLNDVRYDLAPGDLYVVSPMTPHMQSIDDEGMVEYALRFDMIQHSSHTTSHTMDIEVLQIIELLGQSCDKIFHEKYHIERLFEGAFSDAYSKTPGYFINIRQSIMSIILETARLSHYQAANLPKYDLPTRSQEVRQIEIITEFIQDNLTTHISNELLAQHVYMSERQLYRLVKKQVGLSPHQYVSQIRINRVKQLMEQNPMSLKKISELTGFSSEFHLSSTFKKFEKISPTEYMRKYTDPYLDI